MSTRFPSDFAKNPQNYAAWRLKIPSAWHAHRKGVMNEGENRFWSYLVAEANKGDDISSLFLSTETKRGYT